MLYPVTQSGKVDRRYTVQLEHCGYERPHYVARFCGDWIGSSPFKCSAFMLATGHNQARKGALVVVAAQ